MDQLKSRRVLNHITDGSRINTILHRHTDTYRVVQVLVVSQTNYEIEDITRAVSIACDLPLVELGIRVKGSGFNVAQHIAERIELATGLKGLRYAVISTKQD